MKKPVPTGTLSPCPVNFAIYDAFGKSIRKLAMQKVPNARRVIVEQ